MKRNSFYNARLAFSRALEYCDSDDPMLNEIYDCAVNALTEEVKASSWTLYNPDGITLRSTELKNIFKSEIKKYHADKLANLQLTDKYKDFLKVFCQHYIAEYHKLLKEITND